jgi:hypothetical protein
VIQRIEAMEYGNLDGLDWKGQYACPSPKA